MKKRSCGALFYTIRGGRVEVVLGLEKHGGWFVFKGTNKKGETYEETAIREIYEESCGLIRLDKITLDCHFSTSRKHYHIGLVYVPPYFIRRFGEVRKFLASREDTPPDYLEKLFVRSIAISNINTDTMHHLTAHIINFYKQILLKKENELDDINQQWRRPDTKECRIANRV